MFLDKAPEKKRMMLPVQQDVYDRYLKFWDAMQKLARPGMTIEQVGEQIRGEFGDTYWWYNIFGRKIYVINNGNFGHEVQS